MSLSASYPHRIRLRGPWECEPIPSPSTPLPRGMPNTWRVIMPCGWIEAGLADFHGEARFTRRFGYPGNIDETEHIWLTLQCCAGCRDIRLNDQLLNVPDGEDFSFDVTGLMAARNHLDVLIYRCSDRAGIWGEVALEIRKDAFLADVKLVRMETSAILRGNVIGTSTQPLELYTLVDKIHVDYRTIEPTVAGTPFQIVLEDLVASESVRVELIHISSIWYAVELPIPRWQSA